MKITGRVWKMPDDNIDTDQLMPYESMHLPKEERAQHCLKVLYPRFAEEARPGDIILAGKAFGNGSSRPSQENLVHLGIRAVLAESFGRLFYRQSVADGLFAAPCPGIPDIANDGDTVEIDTESVAGQIVVTNLASGRSLSFNALPPFLSDMIEAGGELPYLKMRIARDAAGASLRSPY